MNNSENITIEICVPVWAETSTQWKILIKKGSTSGAWSRGVWFPKSVCVLSRGASTLTLPRWLFIKRDLENDATIINTKKPDQ